MRQAVNKVLLIVASIACIVMPLAPQTAPAQKPSFEVASVKPNRSDVRPQEEFFPNRYAAVRHTEDTRRRNRLL